MSSYYGGGLNDYSILPAYQNLRLPALVISFLKCQKNGKKAQVHSNYTAENHNDEVKQTFQENENSFHGKSLSSEDNWICQQRGYMDDTLSLLVGLVVCPSANHFGPNWINSVPQILHHQDNFLFWLILMVYD